MSFNEVSWSFPQYASQSLLNLAVQPGVCWNTLQNNPFIAAFEVEYLDTQDNIWIPIGRTSANFIRFPSENDKAQSITLESSITPQDNNYRIRVATVGIDGLRSAWSYSVVTLSSPLALDFSTSQTVRLANGIEVPNQRYLFFVF
jgi:hypothetical protein